MRPLRHGDVDTVMAVFERLGEQSRRARFNGPKPRLRAAELEQLACGRLDAPRARRLLQGDPRPVALARLVRDGRSAEIAFEVADEYQRLGIGSALTAELLADARAAGITEVTALVSSDNPAAVALLRPTLGRARYPLRRPGAFDPRGARLTAATPAVPRRAGAQARNRSSRSSASVQPASCSACRASVANGP